MIPTSPTAAWVQKPSVLVQECPAVSQYAAICAIFYISFKTKLANTVLSMLFQVS